MPAYCPGGLGRTVVTPIGAGGILFQAMCLFLLSLVTVSA